MRPIVTAFVLAAALVPALALAAQTPPPSGGVMERKVPLTLRNPGSHKGQSTMSGQGCIASHINASQTEINPITGKPQAAPIVSIPVTGGNVADATTRAQQHHACAHART